MEITNGNVLDRIFEGGISDAINWLMPMSDNLSFSSLHYACSQIKRQLALLNKSITRAGTTEKIKALRDPTFKFPIKGKKRKSTEKAAPIPPKSSAATLIQSYSEIAQSVAQENTGLQMAVTDLESENALLFAKLSTNANYDKVISELKKSLRETETENIEFKSTITAKNEQLKRLRSSVDYEAKCRGKLQQKLDELKQQIHELKQDKVSLQALLGKERSELNQSKAESEWLQESAEGTVIVFDEESKRFTPDLQACVYHLLQNMVKTSHVSSCIAAVLNLCGKTENKLPSKSTVNNMNIQRLILAQEHLAEQFTEMKGTCLLSDETSKYGRQYEGIHAADPTGCLWVLGLRELTTKAATDVMVVLRQILEDIKDVGQCSSSDIAKKILVNIYSTMSDRAAKEKKFSRLLEDYRKEVLQEMQPEEWNAMNPEEQIAISRLNNFFCTLHSMIHAAEVSGKGCLQVENGLLERASLETDNSTKSESGTCRMIRTVSKAFARGGDEKSGMYGPFEAFVKLFLKQHGLNSVPLERYRGNRFNILFSSAAKVFFLAPKLKEYLRGAQSLNRLLQAVAQDLAVPEYLAGCKALGLICHLITIPLWCQIEDREIHIMDMGKIYAELIRYLEDLLTEENLTAFMDGNMLLSFVNERKLQEDPICLCLLTDWEHDAKVVPFLTVILSALCSLYKRIFADHLEGGLWHDASNQLHDRTKGVRMHNKFSETVFGILDRILREKPNVSTITAEAFIMFSHNRTLEWLLAKDGKEQAALTASARKGVEKTRQKFRERQCIIVTRRRDIVMERLAQEEERRDRLALKKETVMNQVLKWGLWQSEEEVIEGLADIHTKRDKVEALRTQLDFRRPILEQKPIPKSVYHITKVTEGKRFDLTVEELAGNVITLIGNALEMASDVLGDGETNIILKKRVRHAFMEDGNKIWYTGKVVSQVSGYPSWFNIKYENDPAIYTYQLGDDLKSGDLRLCPTN